MMRAMLEFCIFLAIVCGLGKPAAERLMYELKREVASKILGPKPSLSAHTRRMTGHSREK